MIEIGDDPELAPVSRGRVRAIRLVGRCIVFLAAVTALMAVVWIIAIFRDEGRTKTVGNELLSTLGMLALPITTLVAGTWVLFRIGRGLRDGSPIARLAAIALITPLCVPPLVIFFSAVRNGVYIGAAVAIAFLSPPAAAVLLLTAPDTDPLFGSKSHAVVRQKGDKPRTKTAAKSPSRRRRAWLRALGPLALVIVSYAVFEVRHQWALGELTAAKGHVVALRLGGRRPLSRPRDVGGPAPAPGLPDAQRSLPSTSIPTGSTTCTGGVRTP